VRAAEAEADVLVWDGGNNDFPFVWPDLHIVVADPHRPGHETRYHPGEANLRMAHVVVIAKVDTAPPEGVRAVRAAVARANPQAAVVEAAMPPVCEAPERLAGRRVVVVEDGPTLTHGEMPHGAGFLAAVAAGAVVVDPRAAAVGGLREVFAHYPHLGAVLPAMGYDATQLRDLEATINRAAPEVVVLGTPADLGRLLRLRAPVVRVRYELEDRSSPTLGELVTRWAAGLPRWGR
jgi:predicted GTPase